MHSLTTTVDNCNRIKHGFSVVTLANKQQAKVALNITQKAYIIQVSPLQGSNFQLSKVIEILI